jgi:hypothetical protein
MLKACGFFVLNNVGLRVPDVINLPSATTVFGSVDDGFGAKLWCPLQEAIIRING